MEGVSGWGNRPSKYGNLPPLEELPERSGDSGASLFGVSVGRYTWVFGGRNSLTVGNLSIHSPSFGAHPSSSQPGADS
jgi:hypothetical protein